MSSRLKTYGPPRLQGVLPRLPADQSASTYPVSESTHQDGDTRAPVLIKSPATDVVFLSQASAGWRSAPPPARRRSCRHVQQGWLRLDDEIFIGGPRPGKRGRGAEGKALVGDCSTTGGQRDRPLAVGSHFGAKMLVDENQGFSGSHGNRGRFWGGWSAWGGADEGLEVGDVGARDAETRVEIVEEGDFEFPAGLEQAEHGVAGGLPASLTVPPEIFRLVTQERISFSEPLVWSGISGRSRTRRSSSFRWCSLARRRSRGCSLSRA